MIKGVVDQKVAISSKSDPIDEVREFTVTPPIPPPIPLRRLALILFSAIGGGTIGYLLVKKKVKE